MRERGAVCHVVSLATTRGNAVPARHSARQDRGSPASLAASGDENPERSSRLAPSPSRLPDCRTLPHRHSDWSWPKAHVDLPLLASADPIHRRARSAWPRTHGGQASLSYIPRPGTPPKTRNACQWASNSIHCPESAFAQQMSREGHASAMDKARNKKARLCDSLICAICSFVRSPPGTAKSSLQSNWKASPGSKCRGTKIPRPVVCCSRWRSAFPIAGKTIPRIVFWPGSYAQKPQTGHRNR